MTTSRDALFIGGEWVPLMGINGYLPDPAGPWGGVKSSGLGRELGPGAITAYQNLKTVYA